MAGLITIVYLIRPAEGGMKTHLLTLLAGLDPLQFSPVVICPPNTPLAQEVAKANIRVIPLDIVDGLNPIKDVQAALKLHGILKKLKPDILHIHGAKAGWIGRLAARKKNNPKIIVTMHSFVLDERMGAQQRKFVRGIERFFSKKTDRIIAVSQALKNELISELWIPESKISVIYNGLQFAELREKVPHNGIRIGTVARLAPQKGLENLIHAASYVVAEFPQANFYIAGEGPRRGHLAELAKSLDLQLTIYLLGYQQDIPGFLATLDVFVLPSTRESFGLTLAEALSQQVPVVATRVDGIPEVVEDGVTGLLATPANPRDLAAKIMMILRNAENAQTMACTGCTTVRSCFTCENMLKETQALYITLMNPPRRKVSR